MYNGAVLYEGPSLFNDEPILCIVTGLTRPSTNIKTGPMAQVYVIPNHKPTEAIKEGSDSSVCGECPLRRTMCYVRPVTLNQVYTAYLSDKYTRNVDWALAQISINRLRVRLTAYGEAPAVPYEALEPLLQFKHTGYTHAWRKDIDERWKGNLMASVQTLAEAKEAQAAGWRTFRITLPDEPLAENEILCLNVKNKLPCSQCLKCSGTGFNVVDPIHGLQHKINTYISFRTTIQNAERTPIA
jgi:hypothetical protein